MAAQDGRDARLYRGAERQKLGLLKLRKRLVYARQAKVRVDRGIAVAGKVLAAAENSRIGISAHSLTGKRGAERIHLLEINTTPGMTATSFIPQQVKAAGKKVGDVLADIIEDCFED